MDMNALLAKASKKVNEDRKNFKPIELTEENVQAIFNRCLKNDKTTDIEYSTLFTKDFGYEQTETPVHFDKNVIRQNIQFIKYLYGQLRIIHEDSFSVTSEGSVK